MIYSTNLLKVNLPEAKYFFYWDKMRTEIENEIYDKNKDKRSENLKNIEKTLEQKIENLGQNKFLVLDFDQLLQENQEQFEIKTWKNLENFINFTTFLQKKLKNLKVFVISDYSRDELEAKSGILNKVLTENNLENQPNSNFSSFLDKLNYTFLTTDSDQSNPQNLVQNSQDNPQIHQKTHQQINKQKILQNLAIDQKISQDLFSLLTVTPSKLDKLDSLKNKLSKVLELDLDLLLLWKNNAGEMKKQLILTLDLYLTFLTRDNILTQNKRVDGRLLDQTREIKCQIEVLPHNHGSSLFSRGETQVLNVLTLGTTRDGQTLDDMENFDEEETKNYIHHYNFPSYSVGETGRYFGPGRREIGHGALAEKALLPVLPSLEKFPYTMRLVSECLGSNGSTSMASTCASTLSLLQGGVPISDSVAGVAMGLVLVNR